MTEDKKWVMTPEWHAEYRKKNRARILATKKANYQKKKLELAALREAAAKPQRI